MRAEGAAAQRIVVTGAGGFVGRHLVREARSQGFRVTGIARRAESARRITEAGGEPEIVGDFAARALETAMAGCRALVHLAHIGAERGGATYEAVNVRGTAQVAEAARRAGVARVVMLSGLGVAHYGMTPRCTNRYFRSKLLAEAELFRAAAKPVIFRPSYIVGPGDGLLTALLRDMARGEVERVGDGSYRLQPIAVRDAAAAIVAAIESEAPGPRPMEAAVFDLVGPGSLTYAELIDRVARIARAQGRVGTFRVREVSVADAERAARAGAQSGMQADELDCLLCDETADPRPVERLLGRPLTPLDAVLSEAVAGTAA